MPNWIMNRVKFQNGADLLKVATKYFSKDIYNTEADDTEPLEIKSLEDIERRNDIMLDFNKVIPMPSELSIESGTATTACHDFYKKLSEKYKEISLESLTNTMVWVYLQAILGDNHENWDNAFTSIMFNVSKPEVTKLLKDEAIAKCMPITKAITEGTAYTKFAVFDCFNAKDNYLKDFTHLSEAEQCRVFIYAYEKGKLVADNITKYGYTDWYSWCVDNWGTKWNASETTVDVQNNCIIFQTAWCSPEGVYQALAEQNPDIYFETEYSDEDFGVNVGVGYTSEGSYCFDYYDDMSKEAYELAADLWGVDLEAEGYIWNEEDGNYEYVDEDEVDSEDTDEDTEM